MASILFYAGPEDNAKLREKIQSLGLLVYKGKFDTAENLPLASIDEYHGIISFQSPHELHPYSGPDHNFPYRISTATDPVIMWLPSYMTTHESNRYIVHGRLLWDFEDVSRGDELTVGKKYFGQLARWIRKNWPAPAKGWVCRGPHAQKMIQSESFIPTGLPPDVKIQYIQT